MDPNGSLSQQCSTMGSANAWNLLVKQRDGLTCVQLDQVEYVVYRDRVLTFMMCDGRAVRSRSLKAPFSQIVGNVFSDMRFVHPHESYVANMDYVCTMTATDFEMKSGARVPISKRVYQRARDEFIHYVVGSGDGNIL